MRKFCMNFHGYKLYVGHSNRLCILPGPVSPFWRLPSEASWGISYLHTGTLAKWLWWSVVMDTTTLPISTFVETQSFHVLSLPLSKVDLKPKLSDKNSMLPYFFMVNRSINLISPFSLAVLMGVHFSLDGIVSNSQSKAVSNFFKASILNCNWREKKSILFAWMCGLKIFSLSA